MSHADRGPSTQPTSHWHPSRALGGPCRRKKGVLGALPAPLLARARTRGKRAAARARRRARRCEKLRIPGLVDVVYQRWGTVASEEDI
eukprot:1410433-Alexandrium_andersonii.AAC.1